MKAKSIIAIAGVALLLSACSAKSTTVVSTRKSYSSKTKSLPPGQAKKINGDKSAKRYAPGHN